MNFLAFKKICIKGLYICKLIDERDYDSDDAEEELVYKSVKNKKLFKTLKYAGIPSACRSHIHESFKYSKNLKSLYLSSYIDETSMSRVAFSIRRLPKNAQIIRLRLMKGDHVANPDIYKIAKSIRVLRQLKYFYRWYALEDTTRKQVPKELRTFDQSVSRLKNMDKIIYNVHENERLGLQRAMSRGSMYPGITGLKVCLSIENFVNQGHFMMFIDGETSQIEEAPFDFENMTRAQERVYGLVQQGLRLVLEVAEDDPEYPPILTKPVNYQKDIEIDEDMRREPLVVDQKFLANIIMREETRPYYRFELFPNLKKLHLSQSDHLHLLGSFVVDGFAALKKLEELKLGITCRPMGSGHFFDGFLQLPLLRKFSLKIPFIRNEEWALLEQFLQGQNKLESLRIWVTHGPSTKARYLQQNEKIEKIIACLENKKLLKSLDLRSAFWSLEALSKGLGRLTMVNQLQSLKLKGSDDTVTSQTKSRKRVEELCNFIKNQKESLKVLNLYLPLVLEDNIVVHIAGAISQLVEIRELYLSFNACTLEKVHQLVQYLKRLFKVRSLRS